MRSDTSDYIGQGRSYHYTPSTGTFNVQGTSNVFGYYNVTSSLSLSLNVNNLTNEFVVTEAEEHTGVSGDIVRARPLSARSTLLSLRYSF